MVRGRTSSCRSCQNRNSRDSSEGSLAVHNPIGRSSTLRHTSIRRTTAAPVHLPTIRRKRAGLHQPTGRFGMRRPSGATSKACWSAGLGQKSRRCRSNVEIRRLHENCCRASAHHRRASAHHRRASPRLHGRARLRHVTRRLRASAISPPQASPSRQTRTLRRAASFASH
jgi:hypothetical protein